MRRFIIYSLLATLLLASGCGSKSRTPPDPPKTPSWTLTGLLKDWLVTPSDVAVHGQELLISGNFDDRVAVVDLNGQVLRYYTVERNPEFDNVCVGVTSQGTALAASSKGVWELKTDGPAVKRTALALTLEHMTVGPDDGLYFSSRSQGQTKISKWTLGGSWSELTVVDSPRISDLAFNAAGDLLLADAQNGRILKYAPGGSVEVFVGGFPVPTGGTALYLAFDGAGNLYVSSAATHLELVSGDGTVTDLEFVNVSGDLVFLGGTLYALDIYTSRLYEIAVDGADLVSKQVILDGNVPWYIDLRGGVAVGQRALLSGRSFCDYDISGAGGFEPNALLMSLQPDQYTFDAAGNLYCLFGNELKKLDPTGAEVYSAELPGSFSWNTLLVHNPVNDMVYYFDAGTNSVMRANAQGAETYHQFLSPASNVSLAITASGKIYAGVLGPDGAKLLDISQSPAETRLWGIGAGAGTAILRVGCDAEGYVYTAVGPLYQSIYRIDPAKGTSVTVADTSTSRYGWGFVDPQGFAVTGSGTVVLSAPGILVKFVPVK